MAIPLLIAGGVLAATGIASAIAKANAAASAAEAQKKSAQDAMDLQNQTYQQQRADQAPWLQAGQTSLADMLRMTHGGYDASVMANDPGFQFRMAQGQQALERSAAARGGLNSGGMMKSLTRYGQGVASDEFQNRFGRLAQLAGLGQSATQNIGGIGSQHANSMSELYGAMGNANAAGAIGQGNGWADGFNAVGQGVAMGMGGFGGGGGGVPGLSAIPGVSAIPKQMAGSAVLGSGRGWGASGLYHQPGTYDDGSITPLGFGRQSADPYGMRGSSPAAGTGIPYYLGR